MTLWSLKSVQSFVCTRRQIGGRMSFRLTFTWNIVPVAALAAGFFERLL